MLEHVAMEIILKIVLNDNGTGKWNMENIIFSILGNGLRIIRATGHETIENVKIKRINDYGMLLIDVI